MDRKIALEWAAALESGQYRQGSGFLKMEDTHGQYNYCCLGVLGELLGAKTTRKLGSICHSFDFGPTCARMDTLLPDSIARDIGLSNDRQTHLAALNDRGVPFTEIAQLIRSGQISPLIERDPDEDEEEEPA